ncbi:MAG: FAD-dependent monooxygenase [Rhizomicrobium sp.]
MAPENQVIIVGAGPVGLMAALSLHRRGIPFVLLEAETALAEDLRASTFHPPTLDMLDDFDLAAPLIAMGLKTPTWQIRLHETHERAEFDLAAIADLTRHPYRLQCEQSKLCRLAMDRLIGLGADIRMGTRLETVAQDDDGVRITARAATGEPVTLTGRFLIGADGARSAVREQAGMTLEGKTYPEVTVLATTPFPFQDHLPHLSNVNYVWKETGTFSLLRLPAIWRCSLYPDPGETVEQGMERDSIERKLQVVVPNPAGYEVLEIRAYRIHMRIADDFRAGRVLLAGDAAHLNSPSGGMGMNGGIHDALELTATLAQVWNGAPLALLDRYTRRRRPVAEADILIQADRNRARMQERDHGKRRDMLRALQQTVADPAASRDYLMRSSMIAGLQRAAAIA